MKESKTKQNYIDLLTDLDIAFIRSKLSRSPSEIELEIIAAIKHYDLKLRPYLQALARMDQAGGWHKNEETSEKILSEVTGETGIKLKGKNKDESVGSLICQGFTPIATLTKRSKKITSSTVLGIPSGIDTSLPNSDVSLFVLRYEQFGSIKDRIIHYLKRPWIYRIIPVSTKGLASSIFDQINDTGYGIVFTADQETILRRDTITVVLMIQKGFEKEISTELKKENISADLIGELDLTSNFTLMEKGKKNVILPLSVFDFIWQGKNINTVVKHNIDTEKQIDLKTIEKPKDLNKVLIQLLQSIHAGKHGRKKISRSVHNYGISLDDPQLNNSVSVTQAECDHFLQLDPRAGGKLAVANAVRQCVCRGAIPASIIIHNILPDGTEGSDTAKGIEMLQGQEEAIRMSNLTMESRQLFPFQNQIKQHITIVGISSKENLAVQRGFIESGDFITMLGSHRGELGGSAYFRHIINIQTGQPPMVDMGMETRLRDVVLQGIQAGFIRSASMVDEGGLAVTIAESLMSSAKGLGARVHLSRKIRHDELIFGETQGLMVITLEEKNIMEFERLCMHGGVPSTTIGRVTDDEVYSFNDEIRIDVSELRKL